MCVQLPCGLKMPDTPQLHEGHHRLPRVFEMGSRIGHDMRLLDIGGASGEEGSNPEFEEVTGG